MPKGRKPCKECGKENVLRALQCDCGFKFVKAAVAISASTETMTTSKVQISSKVQVPNLEEPEEIVETKRHYGSGGRNTFVASGDCPIKPKGYSKTDWVWTDETVKDWALEVYNANETYLPDAVVYFARFYWDINGKDFDRVRKLVFEALQPKKIYEPGQNELVEV